MATIRSDPDVRADVVRALVGDPRIDVGNVDLEVNGGILYLRGTVPDGRQKRLAAELAGAVGGVIDVIDELRVALGPSPSDGALAAGIRAGLAGDSRLGSPVVAVDVSDGVARLSGEVGTYLERLWAGEDAWSVAGVVGVVNEIRLGPARSRSDDAIARDVRSALAGDWRTAGWSVAAEVAHAVVRLGGAVPTERARRLVEDKAWAVAGVRQVVNQLAVLPRA